MLLLLLLLLGLSGAAFSLAAAAAGGAAWAAASASSLAPAAGQERRAASHKGALANGGPAAPAMAAPWPGNSTRWRRGCGEHLASSSRFVLTPRRRYPIHQAQYTSLGTLPSICWDGYRRKNRLSAHNSGMVQSPVMVKIARPDSTFGRSPLLEQMVSPVAFSPTPNSTVDPCAKEAVLSALRENRKRAVEEDAEGRSNAAAQESKRRRHDSSGSGHSAFEPLLANGAPASLIPK
ncbi:hypothetical protein EYD10_16244 [Varanus komodoensis]|nr:hypothetical protein EYD10_16244 [Varanus komodoensis]